jgi:hypothetical protein
LPIREKQKCYNCDRVEDVHYCDDSCEEDDDVHYCEYCIKKLVDETEAEADILERGEELPALCENCRKPKSEFEMYYSIKDTVILCEACYEIHRRQTNK